MNSWKLPKDIQIPETIFQIEEDGYEAVLVLIPPVAPDIHYTGRLYFTPKMYAPDGDRTLIWSITTESDFKEEAAGVLINDACNRLSSLKVGAGRAFKALDSEFNKKVSILVTPTAKS